MLPSSVPDMTARADINKEMQLTDKETNKKIKNRQYRMQNTQKFNKTIHDTSTLSVLSHTITDSKTQSSIDKNIQSLDKLIINDNNKNIKHSIIQNTEIYKGTNTHTHDAPILSLSSSVPDSTTETDLIGDIIKLCKNVKIEHRLWSYCRLNVTMCHGTTHGTPDQSDRTSQTNNINTITFPEQIPKSTKHKSIIINKSHQTLAIPVPVSVTNATNVTIDSGKLPQIQVSHEIASTEQPPNLTAEVDMDERMQLIYNKVNNEKTYDGLCTKLKIKIFNETAHDTSVTSMLPILVPTLKMHPDIAKEMQSIFESICNKETENGHCIIHKTKMFDRTKHDPSVHMQLLYKNNIDRKMEQFHSTMQNTDMYVMELQSCKQVTKKNLMSRSTPDISHYTSANKHDKMDRDPHPIGKSKFPCSHEGCAKSFKNKSKLERHIKIHTGERPFKCNYCNKSFSQKDNLKTHIFIHTGDKLFNCEYCSKSFSLKAYLKTHILIHTGDKPFKCKYCNKSFSQDSTLKRHFRTHTGDKPFKCMYCNKSFSLNCNLKNHIQTHTGDKPFKCTVCNESFSQNSSLKRHFRTHTGDKPFNCEYCDKSFSQKGNLQTHIRTHTGDKLFNCEYCDKSFSQKGNLQLHIQLHTGNKSYTCTECPMKFATKYYLAKHKNEKHKK